MLLFHPGVLSLANSRLHNESIWAKDLCAPKATLCFCVQIVPFVSVEGAKLPT